MEFAIEKVGGIADYSTEEVVVGEGVDAEKVTVYRVSKNENVSKAFLVVRKNTIEVRTDAKLRDLLREKYETVMESRYFGKGGVEIVNSGQLSMDEINDLVRLSYNLSAEIAE